MVVGPLLTALAARIFIGHRVSARTSVAMIVAGFGIAWMYGGQIQGISTVGALAALLVPLAAAINWTVVQHAHAQGQDVDLAPAVLLGAALSSLVTLPLAMPFQASLHDIELLAMLGLVQLAIPCVLTVISARVLKAPEISLIALLEIVFGILLAWAGANEVPQPAVLSGGALVVSALLFNEWSTWRLRR
jgi:drug/metabolite transporter (DMT)-like permease